jgi:predicted O-methyltransferase YrrM
VRFLTRFFYPWRATTAFEWAESFDLLLERKLGRDRTWLQPFDPPRRNELSHLTGCFSAESANKAIELLAGYRDELNTLPPALSLNGYFGAADVAFYWAFIRSRRPNKVVEVGSGYSSRVALRALAKNRAGKLICIDPSPRLHLPTSNLAHIALKIEEVNQSVFADFQPRDILFIDSSHDGDEVRTHAAILDSLPIGALVHYHDIDYPWPRQQDEWTEDGVVNAFLASRPEWNVTVSGSILCRDHLEELRTAIPRYNLTPYRRYNGLWLTRTA